MAKAWALKSRPNGMPQKNDFELIEIERRTLREGEVRIANRFLSVDPYMRGRMNDVKSYTPPFELGKPMQGGAVGEVVESNSPAVKSGQMVQHMAGWRDEAVIAGSDANVLPDLNVPHQAFLGQFGMPGMTAYFGLLDVAGAQAGQTLFVSAAAGAVGSTVVQIAKAKGLTVVGSAGGAEKGEWVRSIGADATIDYKNGTPVVKQLQKAAPGGIDVYFDNVGGDHLDAALACANPRAWFAICGMIDIYNSMEPTELRYLARLIGNRIRMQGFIVSDYMDRAAEFYRDMAGWLADGKLKREETIRDGLDQAPDAFLGLFSGDNTGKMLVRV